VPELRIVKSGSLSTASCFKESIATGFKEFDLACLAERSAQRTLGGFEMINGFRTGQIADSGKNTYKIF
jgi:hypothetical protein